MDIDFNPRQIHLALHRPELTSANVYAACAEAVRLGLGAVFAAGEQVLWCAEALHGTEVQVGAAVGFGPGTPWPDLKLAELRKACKVGATRVDMCASTSALLDGGFDAVENEFDEARQICREHNVKLMLLLEVRSIPSNDVIRRACDMAADLELHGVRAATGTHPAGGADYDSVHRLRKLCPPKLVVKAAGGVSTWPAALSLIGAGADEIGSRHANQLALQATGQLGQSG